MQIEQHYTYVVTDIEIDGPWPGPNSMRSFASVATTANGEVASEFEAVLEPLPWSAPSPPTFAWFQTQGDAWEAATANPEPTIEAMQRWVSWVESLPRPRLFVAHPVSFDALWVDYYLRRFTGYSVVQNPEVDEWLFDGPALCLMSYGNAVLGRPPTYNRTDVYPPEWLGNVPHTHRAIDDARGYANLLVNLVKHAPPGRRGNI